MAKTHESSKRGRHVGYRDPPEEGRIKEGEIRNLWGRKGKPRSQVDFLDEPFELCFDGKTITVPRNLAVDYALFKAALTGKVSAAQELQKRRRDRALAMNADTNADALTSEDEAALDRYIERRLREKQDMREGGDPISSPQAESCTRVQK